MPIVAYSQICQDVREIFKVTNLMVYKLPENGAQSKFDGGFSFSFVII